MRSRQCIHCGKGGDRLHAGDCKLVLDLLSQVSDQPRDRPTDDRAVIDGIVRKVSASYRAAIAKSGVK
jgi:hypothetical protein